MMPYALDDSPAPLVLLLQMYIIPDVQPHVLEAGAIVEYRAVAHGHDDAESTQDWIPARVVRPPNEEGGAKTKMQLHAVSNVGGHAKEMNRQVEAGEEGTMWRWPRPAELDLLPSLGSKRSSSVAGGDASGGGDGKKRKLSSVDGEGGSSSSQAGGDVVMADDGSAVDGPDSRKDKQMVVGATEAKQDCEVQEEGGSAGEAAAIEPVEHSVQDAALDAEVVRKMIHRHPPTKQ